MPFFVISAFTDMLDLAESHYQGKINTVAQILTYSLIIFMPLISVTLRLIETKQ